MRLNIDRSNKNESRQGRTTFDELGLDESEGIGEGDTDSESFISRGIL